MGAESQISKDRLKKQTQFVGAEMNVNVVRIKDYDNMAAF
jgi:hypothetical protein